MASENFCLWIHGKEVIVDIVSFEIKRLQDRMLCGRDAYLIQSYLSLMPSRFGGILASQDQIRDYTENYQ